MTEEASLGKMPIGTLCAYYFDTEAYTLQVCVDIPEQTDGVAETELPLGARCSPYRVRLLRYNTNQTGGVDVTR